MDLFQDLSGITELGILDPLESDALFINEKGIEWINNSSSVNPRTLWFPKTTVSPLMTSLLKSRFVPMNPTKLQAWSHTGPFQALLLRKDMPSLESRNLYWMKAYSDFGRMVQAGEYDNWILWKWHTFFKPQKAFLICHHCGVLPDLRRQLYFLGIQCNFVWLCDGKEPTGDAWPSEFGDFTNSNRLIHSPIGISDEVALHLRSNYDMIITSHCMRYPLHFINSGLPLIHVNSTRFAGGITCTPEFKILCEQIGSAISSGQLRVIHNNLADKWYFEQYIPLKQFPVISSLCTSPLRFQIEVPKCQENSKQFLIWDTRYHIIDKNASKTLRAISAALKGSAISTSELSTEKQSYLDDDMLEPFQAVIHIPYNISTMSCFEQASANIPIWVPTPEFLERILLDPEEYSELSWYSFSITTRSRSEWPDQVWNPDVVKEFVTRSDFYCKVFKNVLFFSSVQDLVDKIGSVNYDSVMKDSFQFQVKKRLTVLRQYREFFRNANI